MKMNEIFGALGNVLKRNENTIVGVVVSGGLYYFLRKVGMNVSFGEIMSGGKTMSSGTDAIDISSITYVRNATEAAIKSTMDSAMSMSFDSSKNEAIRNIRRLITENTDDDTRKFAIDAISRIRSSMTFDSNKKAATDAIVAIAK